MGPHLGTCTHLETLEFPPSGVLVRMNHECRCHFKSNLLSLPSKVNKHVILFISCFQSVQVKLVLGHKAHFRDEPTEQGYTHDWTVYVCGPDGNKIQPFVEKVVFHLHASFKNPKRGDNQ